LELFDVIVLFILAYAGGVIANILPFTSKDQIYQTIQPLIKELMKDDSQKG
jgi:hypothetical protein